MARLRCTKEEAKAEAIRIATEFEHAHPNWKSFHLLSATPDNSPPRADSGKIPAVWSVVFVPRISGATIDGGELFICVNVQTKTAAQKFPGLD
jgi:hypothetical protein